ncbi:NAD-dependent epimerase/dehydratase family protein [Pelotomaculum terephthalicicum JT]|uniref:NAD-dependent epimerase/dehydratase family protein n=1 Tax=Pelotomaculum terephthalicicum TaxID=206393 RepID=UPI001F0505CC|nr:NAD-dependent epimerase/dehydratase family protein [Pelotomaculum terephthalicicum]MCG9969064.1 NAD-dependent epimerase/dehydratase family protein [Pelotomaculum terephthalicicum JT]
MSRIFLTGTTGFIGGHLVRHLARRGEQVTCLVRKENALKGSPHIKLLKEELGALCDRELACRLISGHDYVIHCAAIRGEMRLPWSDYFKINVDATCSLLEAAGRAGVKKFLYLSSVGVLGTMPLRLPASEDTPYNPDSNYHRSKALAEKQVIECSSSGLDTVVIRPSITYGPEDNGFLLRIIRMAEKGYFPLISGGKNKIHLTYVDGLVDAMVKALDSSLGSGKRVYTIVDSQPICFKELIEMIADSLGRKVKIINIPSKTLLFLGTRSYDAILGPVKKSPSLTMSAKILALPWYYDAGRAKRELSYTPFDTRKRVPETVRWLKENGWLN